MDKVKNQQKERILKSISTSLTELGFQRSKPTFWVKELTNTIHFIHIHTFSFDYSLRIHLGVRVKNDSFDAASLNGPYSNDGWWKSKSLFSKRKELSFNEKEESVEVCANNTFDFIKTEGIPWFSKYENDNELISNENSPLDEKEKASLIEMIKGNPTIRNIELSNEIFRLDKLKNIPNVL